MPVGGTSTLPGTEEEKMAAPGWAALDDNLDVLNKSANRSLDARRLGGDLVQMKRKSSVQLWIVRISIHAVHLNRS